MKLFSFLGDLFAKDAHSKDWFQEQQRRLLAGEEIEPPWIAYPHTDGWWGGWRQGNSQFWLESIWLPYWGKLSDKDRVEYAQRWEASSEWREYLFDHWK